MKQIKTLGLAAAIASVVMFSGCTEQEQNMVGGAMIGAAIGGLVSADTHKYPRRHYYRHTNGRYYYGGRYHRGTYYHGSRRYRGGTYHPYRARYYYDRYGNKHYYR